MWFNHHYRLTPEHSQPAPEALCTPWITLLTYGWYWKTWVGGSPSLNQNVIDSFPLVGQNHQKSTFIRTEVSGGRTRLTAGRLGGQLVQALR